MGWWRSVFRRVGANQWEDLGRPYGLRKPKADRDGMNMEAGFSVIAGFNANDLYCTGGHADVWRFDGAQWHECPVPTNLELSSVCCAGDGYVYIGGDHGTVFKGRENQWRCIHNGKFSLDFQDMVWFDGKLWCTSDYGLWTIENDILREADVPAFVRCMSGHLAAGHGLLLVAGHNGAALFDGKEWQLIVETPGNGIWDEEEDEDEDEDDDDDDDDADDEADDDDDEATNGN